MLESLDIVHRIGSLTRKNCLDSVETISLIELLETISVCEQQKRHN